MMKGGMQLLALGALQMIMLHSGDVEATNMQMVEAFGDITIPISDNFDWS